MPCSSYCKILAADIVQLRGVVIVMAKTGASQSKIPVAIAVFLIFASVSARGSQESVDRDTQAALALDAHPTRGASQFARYCASCHGLRAEGDAGRATPALAGQRFTYLVRQLADFAGAERDSNTMHRVLGQKELRGRQSWV